MSEENARRYTTEEGIEICRKVEEQMVSIGYHVALGGSLVYRGYSKKDIDIILYPHSRGDERDKFFLMDHLRSLGYIVLEEIETATGVPDVLPTKDSDGRRIDFFFMCRPYWK